MRRFAAICAVALVSSSGAAVAGGPGTDGGPADRGCEPVINDRFYVGATKMSCKNAREIAETAIRGKEPRRWDCTGVGGGFGHCHGKRGRVAHWAVND